MMSENGRPKWRSYSPNGTSRPWSSRTWRHARSMTGRVSTSTPSRSSSSTRTASVSRPSLVPPEVGAGKDVSRDDIRDLQGKGLGGEGRLGAPHESDHSLAASVFLGAGSPGVGRCRHEV